MATSAPDAGAAAAADGGPGAAGGGTRAQRDDAGACPTAAQWAVAAVGAVALAAALLAAGLGACCLEPATALLSVRVSNFADSPYAPAQLTELAVQTRAFTVEGYGRAEGGTRAAVARLGEAVADAARASMAPGSPTADRWPERARLALSDSSGDGSDAQAAERLAAAGDAYALDAAALSHLEDCNRLIGAAAPALWAAAGAAAACLAALLAWPGAARAAGRRAAGRMLTAGPLVILAALAALGAWALVDFDGFFAAFHGVFFPQGNWTFPWDSLLICMYPPAFWVGMGVIWLVTSGLLSILSLVAGRALTRPRPHRLEGEGLT